jgi:hypothetical protein
MNCDQSQQHQRRPKPNFNHDTHREDAKPSDHQQHQKRIQKTTLRNEAYADVRREGRKVKSSTTEGHRNRV